MAIERVLGGVQTRPLLPGADQGTRTPGAGFGSSLEKLVTSIETTNADANTAVGQMLNGTGDVH